MTERSTLFGWLLKIGLVVIGLAVLKGVLFLQKAFPDTFKCKSATILTKYVLVPLGYIYGIIVIAAFIIL